MVVLNLEGVKMKLIEESWAVFENYVEAPITAAIFTDFKQDPKEAIKDEQERKEKYYQRIEKIKDANCNSEVYFVSDNQSIAE